MEQQIQQHMGEASVAKFDAGEVRWKRSRDGTALDVDRLLADHPELVSQYAQHYTVAKPGSRRFTVKINAPTGP